MLGWTDPHGARSGLGALLVGYYDDGELRFGGKVGTGFGERELAMLTGRLTPLERADPPIADAKGLSMKGVHWVRPELVAQVGFSEWTPTTSCDIPATSGSATTSGRSRSSASRRRKRDGTQARRGHPSRQACCGPSSVSRSGCSSITSAPSPIVCSPGCAIDSP